MPTACKVNVERITQAVVHGNPLHSTRFYTENIFIKIPYKIEDQVREQVCVERKYNVNLIPSLYSHLFPVILLWSLSRAFPAPSFFPCLPTHSVLSPAHSQTFPGIKDILDIRYHVITLNMTNSRAMILNTSFSN